MSTRKNTQEDIYRLFDAIQPDEAGCLIWTGASRRMYVNGKRVVVYRAALEQKLGRPIKPGYFACHHCDVSYCVNPDHIYEGTAKDNVGDMMKRNLNRREQWIAMNKSPERRAYQSEIGSRPENIERLRKLNHTPEARERLRILREKKAAKRTAELEERTRWVEAAMKGNPTCP
jgi:hypothetical protein